LVNWIIDVVVGVHLSPSGHQVGVAVEWSLILLIGVTFSWQDRLSRCHLPNCNRSNTVVIKDKEIGEHTGSALNNTDLEVTERNELCIYEMISLGVPRLSFHDIEFWVLIGEGNGWHHIASKIDTKNEHS